MVAYKSVRKESFGLKLELIRIEIESHKPAGMLGGIRWKFESDIQHTFSNILFTKKFEIV